MTGLRHLTMFFIVFTGITVFHANTVYPNVIITNDSNYKIEVAYFLQKKGATTQVLAPYAAIELVEYPDRLSVRRYGIGSSMTGYTSFDNQLKELWSDIWKKQRLSKYAHLIPMFRIVPTYFGWKIVLGWDDPNSATDDVIIN